MNKPLKQAELKYKEAYDLVITELERRARKILREHPNLDEYIMAMGGWMFTRKLGTRNEQGFIVESDSMTIIHEDEAENIQYMRPIYDLMREWDNDMKLTGDAMRFTAEGEVVRTWGGKK